MIPLPPRADFDSGPAFRAGPLFGAPSGDRDAERVRCRAVARRSAQVRRAQEVFPLLPGPGEAVHCRLLGYFDLMLVVRLVCEGRGVPCSLVCATLAFSSRNVQELAEMLDAGRLTSLHLLCSDYMRRANAAVYAEAVAALREARGQRVGAARSHCKVVCMAFADGMRLVMEGSANLRTNRNTEQMTLINSAEIHDFHAEWVRERVHDGERREQAD